MARGCCTRSSRRRADLENITADTLLSRCLGLFDLTSLGIGAGLGFGVYVLAAELAQHIAGPAVCISFLIAGFASALTGLCYAELASRIPKAGSAYVYTYVTAGEPIAFLMGWNLILEHIIGVASVARGFSVFFDYLTGNVISKSLRQAMPMDISFLFKHPDFFAFGVVMLIAILLAIGIKETTRLNNVFTAISLITISIIIVAGLMNADPGNWFIAEENIPEGTENTGRGGFMPFGIKGVWTGAATCFFAFVGVDAITTTGEEAKNPQRNIPWAIGISFTIVFVAYFGVSTVLTMMWPYYDQTDQPPFLRMFDQIGWPNVKWIVNIGVLFSFGTSLIGGMLPLSRVVYALASDGLIFKFLGEVSPSTHTPIAGTIICGLLSGIAALIFNVNMLIHMMSIGTLLAHGIVVLNVLRLRYQPELHKITLDPLDEPRLTFWTGIKKFFNVNGDKKPTEFSGNVVHWCVTAYGILVPIITTILNEGLSSIMNGNVGLIAALCLVGSITLLVVIAISRQPVLDIETPFKVPFSPLLPFVSCFINTSLMGQLSMTAWAVFGCWMVIGFVFYYAYGFRNSIYKLRDELKEQELVQRNSNSDEKLAEARSVAKVLKLDTIHLNTDICL